MKYKLKAGGLFELRTQMYENYFMRFNHLLLKHYMEKLLTRRNILIRVHKEKDFSHVFYNVGKMGAI
jgi:hypothetical protein